MPSRTLPIALAVLLVVAAGCSGGDDDSSAADPPPPSTTESTVRPTSTEPPDDGDETVLLDGFLTVSLPPGWGVAVEEPVEISVDSPPETDLDADALDQVVVLNPDEDSRAATFALVHYSHSDKVPGLEPFDAAVSELLAGDGSTIEEPSEASFGGQEALLHEVRSASGANGVLVTLVSGGEYFFVLSLADDPDQAEAAATLLTSVRFDPDALGS